MITEAPMHGVTRLRKRTAAVLVVAVMAIGLSACFPDVQSGDPPDQWNAALIRAINRDRANNGLPALSYSPKLENLAGTWAQHMSDVDTMYHQDLNAIIRTSDYANYCTLGENIAWTTGNWTAEQFENLWYNSAPHRANILNRSFNVVGTGRFRGANGKTYAAVDFGNLCR
jgi:uncharacterized protein YkwD